MQNSGIFVVLLILMLACSVKTLTLVSSIYIFDIGCIYIVNLSSSKHKVVQSTKSRVLFVINVEQMFNYFLVVT